jgi:hypothetical protein
MPMHEVAVRRPHVFQADHIKIVSFSQELLPLFPVVPPC